MGDPQHADHQVYEKDAMNAMSGKSQTKTLAVELFELFQSQIADRVEAVETSHEIEVLRRRLHDAIAINEREAASRQKTEETEGHLRDARALLDNMHAEMTELLGPHSPTVVRLQPQRLLEKRRNVLSQEPEQGERLVDRPTLTDRQQEESAQSDHICNAKHELPANITHEEDDLSDLVKIDVPENDDVTPVEPAPVPCPPKTRSPNEATEPRWRNRPFIETPVFLRLKEEGKVVLKDFTSLTLEVQIVLKDKYATDYHITADRSVHHTTFMGSTGKKGQMSMIRNKHCMNVKIFRGNRHKKVTELPDIACRKCRSTQRICGPTEIHEGKVVHCLYPHPSLSGRSGEYNGSWQDAKCWTGDFV